MKKCTKCGLYKKKSTENFYIRNSSKDGFKNVCKDCISILGRKRYLIQRDKILERAKIYYINNRGKKVERMRIYNHSKRGKELFNIWKESERGRESRLNASKRSREKFPERSRARELARYYIPLSPCEICGVNNNIHRHHFDYSKPLDVMMLCRNHHNVIHKIMDKILEAVELNAQK